MGNQKLAKGEPKNPLIIKAACTLRTALLLTSLEGFVLPTSSSRNKKLIPPAGWRKEPASSACRRLMQTMFCLDYRKATQVTIVNGLIGHDPPEPWNWEGPLPGWNRATFRAGSFEKLAAFMTRIRKNSNVHSGFHLNNTDVKIGLCDNGCSPIVHTPRQSGATAFRYHAPCSAVADASAVLQLSFDSSAFLLVAGVILFESTTFSSRPYQTLPGVKTFEATGRQSTRILGACRT
jgi:hypothetical protein